MTGYFELLDKLKTHFDADVIVNTVTQGDIFKVDLSKQTIFPLLHIMVNNCNKLKWNIFIKLTKQFRNTYFGCRIIRIYCKLCSYL